MPSTPSLPLIEDLLRGDRRSIARAISLVERGGECVHDVRIGIREHLGRAHVVGVTGPPGGGKSTLVSALITELRKRRKTVAVLAVDPSSPFTGGAVLGDRIRMGANQDDEGVFIRSIASRGQLGGLSACAADVIDVFDAAGFDVVLVETVGSGQSEVEITRFADTRLVVCPPGLGDDVQAIKAGILEIADAFVVTKSDLPDAARTERELKAMLALRTTPGELPPVIRTQALQGTGVADLAGWLADRTQRGRRYEADGSRAATELLDRLIRADRFAQENGFELVAAAPGSATVRMRVQPKHINFNGRCHGGAVFALGDMALGLACNSYGKIGTLVDGQMCITSAVEEGEWLVAHAVEMARSRKIGSYQVQVKRSRDDTLVASVHGTVYFLDKPVEPEASGAAG